MRNEKFLFDLLGERTARELTLVEKIVYEGLALHHIYSRSERTFNCTCLYYGLLDSDAKPTTLKAGAAQTPPITITKQNAHRKTNIGAARFRDIINRGLRLGRAGFHGYMRYRDTFINPEKHKPDPNYKPWVEKPTSYMVNGRTHYDFDEMASHRSKQ